MCLFKKNNGQAFIEGLIAVMVITIFMFALIQVCIIVVNDTLYNEVAFMATRAVSVAKHSQIKDTAQKVADKMFQLNGLSSKNIDNSTDDDGSKTTNWDGTVLGKDIKDHNGVNLKKYNVKIKYNMKVIFASLFDSSRTRTQWSRARMIKSPDEEYYYKAYPGAKEFIKIGNEKT
jgi:superfamily II RNA helicase